MFNLLSWLWDRAGRVYAFFGWLYDRIRDAALNAWNWAVDRANAAYTAASWWIRYYYNQAVGLVNRLRTDAWTWIVDTWGRITDQIAYAFGEAWYWIQFFWVKARDFAIAKFLEGLAAMSALFDRAVEGAQNLVNGVIALANALFDRALIAAVELFQKVNAELAEFKLKIGIDTPEEEATLRAWITNPFGTLAAYLKLFFMGMLEYSVAYGLGTIKYTLPPWPDFSPGGDGAPIPGGPPPPPGPSGLMSPLSTIYVSGYRFGPGHPGIDLGLARDQTVFAMHGGKVKAAYFSLDGYGKMIILDGGEWWTRYAHLSDYLVSEGSEVRAGDAIALGNSTGNSTGDHLHLEIKRYGSFIDPMTVL